MILFFSSFFFWLTFFLRLNGWSITLFQTVESVTHPPMPNWIHNWIYFETTSKLARKVMKYVASKEQEFDFRQIVPEPKFDDLTSAATHQNQNPPLWVGSTRDWYVWRLLHWGTKWNADEIVIQTEEYGNDQVWVLIGFHTANDPPKPILLSLSRHFPSIEFGVLHANDDVGRDVDVYNLVNGKDDDEEPFPRKSAAATVMAKAIVQELPVRRTLSNSLPSEKEIISTTVTTRPTATMVSSVRKSKRKHSDSSFSSMTSTSVPAVVSAASSVLSSPIENNKTKKQKRSIHAKPKLILRKI